MVTEPGYKNQPIRRSNPTDEIRPVVQRDKTKNPSASAVFRRAGIELFFVFRFFCREWVFRLKIIDNVALPCYYKSLLRVSCGCTLIVYSHDLFYCVLFFVLCICARRRFGLTRENVRNPRRLHKILRTTDENVFYPDANVI